MTWKNIMKCYPFEEKRLAKYPIPYIVQPKLDGIRCRAVPTTSGYILLSSEENIIFSCPHIVEQLNRWDLGLEFDGELYNHSMSFEEICSITLRKSLSPYHKSIQFWCFDIVCDQSQIDRINLLTKLGLSSDCFTTVPYFLAYSLEDINEIYNDILLRNYEGIIVRSIYAPYENKRSLNLMKFKPKKSDLYQIVGVKEEVSINGEPKDRLGALILDSGDGDTFAVGTGFSDYNREQLWRLKDGIIGKQCTIGYQNITSKGKPRFPVFFNIKL